MTDIFISYSSQDREWIKKLIDILEINNFDIWWDSYIDTGSHYPKQIENALNNAECVIVVWSDFSVNSEWVYSEAKNAYERKILIPVKIDESKIPLPFNTVQTIDMSSWDWSINHKNYKLLLDGIYNFVSKTKNKKNIKSSIITNNQKIDFIKKINTSPYSSLHEKKENQLSRIDNYNIDDLFISYERMSRIFKEIDFLITDFKHHIQYHIEHKRDLIEELYLSEDLTSLNERFNKVKKLSKLNVLNFEGKPYIYQELVDLLICDNQRAIDKYKVYGKSYYDIYKLCSTYYGEKLLYLDYIESKETKINKCIRKTFKVYETYTEFSNLSTSGFANYSVYYHFDVLEKGVNNCLSNMGIESHTTSKKLFGILIECFSTYDFPIRNDVIIYTKNKKYGIKDKEKNILIKAKYDYIGEFTEKGYATYKLNGYMGLIDSKGNLLVKEQFDRIHSYLFDFDDVAKTEKNGKYGLIDKKGNILLYPEYDDIGYFHNGIASIRKGLKKGQVNEKGELITPLTYIGLIKYTFKDL